MLNELKYFSKCFISYGASEMSSLIKLTLCDCGRSLSGRYHRRSDVTVFILRVVVVVVPAEKVSARERCELVDCCRVQLLQLLKDGRVNVSEWEEGVKLLRGQLLKLLKLSGAQGLPQLLYVVGAQVLKLIQRPGLQQVCNVRITLVWNGKSSRQSSRFCRQNRVLQKKNLSYGPLPIAVKCGVCATSVTHKTPLLSSLFFIETSKCRAGRDRSIIGSPKNVFDL